MPVTGRNDQGAGRNRKSTMHLLTLTLITLTLLLAALALTACGGDQENSPTVGTPTPEPTSTPYVPPAGQPSTFPPMPTSVSPLAQIPRQPTSTPGYIFKMPERPTPEPTLSQGEKRILIGGEQEIPGLVLPRLRLNTGQATKVHVWLLDEAGVPTRLTEAESQEVQVTSHDPERINVLGRDVLLAPFSEYGKVTVTWREYSRSVVATATGQPHRTMEEVYELEIYPRVIIQDGPGHSVHLTAKAYYGYNYGPIPQDTPYSLFWHTGNPEIATIDQNGLLTVLGVGWTTVQVYMGHFYNDPGTDVMIFGPIGIPESQDIPLCWLPMPEDKKYSYRLNRMRVHTAEDPPTEIAGRQLAKRLGGGWINTKKRRGYHVIDFPCTGNTPESRLNATNDLIRRILQDPEVTWAVPEVDRTPKEPVETDGAAELGTLPTPEPTPDTNPDITPQPPQVPPKLGDDVATLSFRPNWSVMEPRGSIKVMGNLLVMVAKDEHTEARLVTSDQPLLTVIEPVRPESGAKSPDAKAPSRPEGVPSESQALIFNRSSGQEYAAVNNKGILSVSPDAPFISFNVTIHHQGRTASHRVDVRGPQPPHTCDGDVSKMEIQWEEGTPTPDGPGWHTLARYPEFNTTIVEIPCTPDPAGQAMAKAQVIRAVRYRPTGNEERVPLVQYRPTRAQGTILLHQGQSMVLEVEWGEFADGSIRRLTADQQAGMTLEWSPEQYIETEPENRRWKITAVQPGKTILMLTGDGMKPAAISVVTPLNPGEASASSPGKVAVKLRMGPGGEDITAYTGETIQVTLSVVYDDGSEKALDPRKDRVAFVGRPGGDPKVSADGVIEIGEARRAWQGYVDLREFTAVYAGLRAKKEIAVKEPPPAPPTVDRSCMYRPEGSPRDTNANTVLITKWYDSNSMTTTDEMRDLGVRETGKREKAHILTFPCNSPQDLQRAWTAIYKAKQTKEIIPYPITGARTEVKELHLGYKYTMDMGETDEANLEFIYQDGSTRDPTPEQLAETTLISLDPDVVQVIGGLEYTGVLSGITTLRATYQGRSAEISSEVEGVAIDRECRLWYEGIAFGGNKTINFQRLNALRMSLNKQYGRDTAQQIADQLGATLLPGFRGLEAAPTYTLDLNRECNPLGRNLQEIFGGNREARESLEDDPRVMDLNHPRGGIQVNSSSTGMRLPGIERATLPTVPTDIEPGDVAGISAYVKDPKNISPLNGIAIVPHIIDTDGQLRQMPDDMISRVRMTSSNEQVAWVEETPDRYHAPKGQPKHQMVRAGRPGQADVIISVDGHTGRVPVTVQPPLAVFAEVAPKCTEEIRGITFSPSRMILTLSDATGLGHRLIPEHANAVGGNLQASVVASTPDGRTHMLQGRCSKPGQPWWYSRVWGTGYAEVSSAHMQIISIDGLEPEAGPRDFSLTQDEKTLNCESHIRIGYKSLKTAQSTWDANRISGVAIQKYCTPEMKQPIARDLPEDAQVSCADRAVLDPGTLPSGLKDPDGGVRRDTGMDEARNTIIHWDPDNGPKEGPNCWIYLSEERRWRLK